MLRTSGIPSPTTNRASAVALVALNHVLVATMVPTVLRVPMVLARMVAGGTVPLLVPLPIPLRTR